MCGNEVVFHIVTNHVYHKRTKHVEMDCYFVHEQVSSGEIQTLVIQSKH